MRSLPIEIIGSVSHATMRTEDLIPAFMGVLTLNAAYCGIEDRVKAIQEDIDKLVLVYDAYGEHYTDDTQEAAFYILNEDIWDIMSDIAPPGYYFGAHPEDGSDYGFWNYEPEDLDYNLWMRDTTREKTVEVYTQILDIVNKDQMSEMEKYRGRLWAKFSDIDYIFPCNLFVELSYEDIYQSQLYGDIVECPVDNDTLTAANDTIEAGIASQEAALSTSILCPK